MLLKKKIFFFILIFFLITGLTKVRSVEIPEWFKITKDKKGNTFYLKFESIQQNLNNALYWAKVKLKEKKYFHGKKVDHVEFYLTSDCHRNMFSVTYILCYDSNRNLLFSDTANNYNQILPLLPDSSIEKLHEAACFYLWDSD